MDRDNSGVFSSGASNGKVRRLFFREHILLILSISRINHPFLLVVALPAPDAPAVARHFRTDILRPWSGWRLPILEKDVCGHCPQRKIDQSQSRFLRHSPSIGRKSGVRPSRCSRTACAANGSNRSRFLSMTLRFRVRSQSVAIRRKALWNCSTTPNRSLSEPYTDLIVSTVRPDAIS